MEWYTKKNGSELRWREEWRGSGAVHVSSEGRDWHRNDTETGSGAKERGELRAPSVAGMDRRTKKREWGEATRRVTCFQCGGGAWLHWEVCGCVPWGPIKSCLITKGTGNKEGGGTRSDGELVHGKIEDTYTLRLPRTRTDDHGHGPTDAQI